VPDSLQCQINRSSTSRASWTVCGRSRTCTYWTMTGTVLGPVTSRIHSPFRSAEATVRAAWRLGGTASTNSGASSAIDCPSSQSSFQKEVFSPLPMTGIVEAWKRATVVASSFTGAVHDRRATGPERLGRPGNEAVGPYSMPAGICPLAPPLFWSRGKL
jgi:hypothetical protein